jgi:hypothetical protein
MPIDREYIARGAGHGYKAEPVTLAMLDTDNSQIDALSTNKSSFPIDQGGIRHLDGGDIRSRLVIPARKRSAR